MRLAGWDIDILIQGYPGKTLKHGGLGWSTVVLLRGHGRVAILDTGAFGARQLLLDGTPATRAAAGGCDRPAPQPSAL